MKPVSTLYIGFKNQTHGSVYELPESADYRELITFSLIVIVATTDDLGIDVKAFGNGDSADRQYHRDLDWHWSSARKGYYGYFHKGGYTDLEGNFHGMRGDMV